MTIDSQRSFEVYGLDANSPGFEVSDGIDTITVGTEVASTIISRGIVRDANGNLLAQRTLIVPQGLMTNVYERP